MNSSRNLSVRRRKSVTRYGATAVVSATAIASAGAVVPLTAPAPGPSTGRRGGVGRTAFVIGASLLGLADGAGRRAVLVARCREVRLCSPRVVNFVAMFIGLGLESVFDMVRTSDRIDIPGTPELGTTSRVYLPPTRNADSTAPIACRATTAGSAPGKAAIRVAAVDVSYRTLVARALRVAKYVILETAGDAEAPAAGARYDGDMCLLGISYGEADARRHHQPRRFVTRNAVRHSSPQHLGEGGTRRQCGRGTARGSRGSHRADLRPRGRRR